MCLPVGVFPEIPSEIPGSTATEREALGALMHRDRKLIGAQVKRRLKRRQACIDLREDGVSAFYAEMFRRLEARGAEQRELTIEDWSRLVWNHALAEAVRAVDSVLGYPVRRAQRARRGAEWQEYTEDELLLVEGPMIAAARRVIQLRPDDAAALIAACGSLSSSPGGDVRAQARLRRRLTAELGGLLKAHL
jgi:hypothetical protein